MSREVWGATILSELERAEERSEHSATLANFLHTVGTHNSQFKVNVM
jgi:hypothetical protein